MAGTKISFNINAPLVKDNERLKKVLKKMQPTAVLVMDGLGFIKELQSLLPNTLFIHRNYGIFGRDDDVHLRVSPEQWMAQRAQETDGGVYLYTSNEPAFSQECIDWHVQLMELAVQRRVRLVIGNWAVGNPGPDEWGRAARMLELLDQHRDLFILGLHEYACGVVTSGLYGGYPDNAGVAPGSLGGQDLIPPSKWPEDTSTVTMFHLGRFNFLLRNYCQKIGMKSPRIILTEHGMDDVSDIKEWAKTLDKTSPYSSIRAWKSLRTQWENWFRPQGWSAERAYFEQLKWADQKIYHNSPVEAQCIFSWGNSDQSWEWEAFDISQAFEFQELLMAYAEQGVPHAVAVSTPASPATAQPASASGSASQPVIVQPIGVVPVGAQTTVATPAVSVPVAVPAVAVAVAFPAIAVPVGVTQQAAAPASPSVRVEVQLSNGEIDSIVSTLRGLSGSAANPAAFNRLADALLKAKQ